ncbi:MAG: zinc ribbon domain-containing protein [Gemmataceae bacterium]|nr:zinc ribbon domain-containing protein [Planctomycetia bacterium]MBX3397177.1 zinc ribbon domain-containing protein [Gemmataceae bacterium]
MPTYDYQCDACNHAFEEWQSFHDAELTKCPKCKKKKLRRLLGGGAALIFKGSGFYETDYRKESYTEAAKKDKEAAEAKPTETKAETKSETTETKVEAKPKTESKPKKKK